MSSLTLCRYRRKQLFWVVRNFFVVVGLTAVLGTASICPCSEDAAEGKGPMNYYQCLFLAANAREGALQCLRDRCYTDRERKDRAATWCRIARSYLAEARAIRQWTAIQA